MIVVRSGPLTEAAIRALSDVVLLLSAVASEREPFGFLSVVPAEAGVSDPRLIELQLQLLRTLDRSPNVFAALCVLGDDPRAPAMTQAAAKLSAWLPNARTFSETAVASRWFGEAIAIDPREIQRRTLEVGFLAK